MGHMSWLLLVCQDAGKINFFIGHAGLKIIIVFLWGDRKTIVADGG